MTSPLRTGFTTGSAASAAAVAAFRQSAAPVMLLLPGGKNLEIPVARLEGDAAVVVKDGGDDPDVTSGCEIIVHVKQTDEPPLPEDYLVSGEDLTLVVRGGRGVGKVTRPGLSVPVGKWAINPVPRRMLLENLHATGARGHFLVTIEVPRGEDVAKETLNPTLGILGGISIIGTSGIVYPYSNAAYAATIALQLRSVKACGGTIAALATGGRSAAAVARDFPEIPPEAIVRIGDFIQVAIHAAAASKLERLIVACMPGKLFKYACGEAYTHAHTCKLTPERMEALGVHLPDVNLSGMDTMGELSHAIGPERFLEVLRAIHPIAHHVLQEWAGELPCIELILYDDKGAIIQLR
ncbi:MAG: cobalt-precorrin-5B (C(1))-methyltransferase [Victivallales bacterium]|nr:cobalt-precorrin-5B (C(1))-methyltransferase [Victivallales bacterium]